MNHRAPARRGHRTKLAEVCALAALLTGCEPRNVTVFRAHPSTNGDGGTSAGRDAQTDASAFLDGANGTIPDANGFADATPPGDAGRGCVDDAECPPSWLCSKPDCGRRVGACEPRPVLCDGPAAPVCGCDHVTYWNDCVRRQNGVSASSSGECRADARACNVAPDCGVPGASCAHFLPPTFPCGPPGPGTCWVTPVSCSATSDPNRWIQCVPFGIPPPPLCVTTCTAIQSGGAYIPAPPQAPCN